MHFLLSPAKTLDFETPLQTTLPATRPQFVDRSAELIDLLKARSPDEIGALMALSGPLAALNVARYRAWSTRFTPHNSRPAALAFDGDVYGGLDARSLADDDLAWAQAHVSILSGLYGILRPLDRLQPYRLEMGTPLANAHGRNLYAFWGDTLAEHLNRRVASDPVPVIVNLASQEYFQAVNRPALKPRVVTCVFEDWKGGGYKVISFFAKRARGLMLRHAIARRCAVPMALESFDAEGYGFDAAASEPDRMVFRRRTLDDTPPSRKASSTATAK
jgi:cytoplasmic iron level regulating protein YaaA (DUF328/UPF0246 family)